jgi:hypothetical protein
LPDKTKIPIIEFTLKRLEEAHLDALKGLRGLTVEEEAHLDSLKSLRGLTVEAGGVDDGAAGAADVESFFNHEAVAGVSFQDGQSSAGGVLNLLNFLQSLSRDNRKLIEMHLTTEAADMLRKAQAILKDTEVLGNCSAKPVRQLVRSRGGSVQRQDEEENRVFKVLEDLHAWPKQVVEEVEVSQLMGAMSLSAHERAGDESVVFPLVVVRVLQVSYCLFKSMCCICP